MKKIILFTALGLLSAMGYSQISFVIQSQSFTRPDTVVFLNTTANTNTVKWTFPGGTVPPDSTNNSYVTVIYKTPGKYAVSLKIDTGGTAIIDTTVKNFVFAPGIITKDTILCFSDTLRLVARGGFSYSWTNSDIMDSVLTVYSPSVGYYKVAIVLDTFYTKTMMDSVKVSFAVNPGVQYVNTPYCYGDSVALKVSNAIKSYTVSNMMLLGEEKYILIDTLGPFSNTHPYYYYGFKTDYIAYTDTLGCNWTASYVSIGSDSILRPKVSLSDKIICKGSSYDYGLSSYELPVYWYNAKDSLLSPLASYQPSDSGGYVVKIFDSSNTCSTNDTVHISYFTANPNTLTSVNYLPGIGYVSTYAKSDAQNYAKGFALYNTKNTRIDSVGVGEFSGIQSNLNSYGKLPIIIDTNTYTKAPGLFMTSYNSCNVKASSDTVSPVWLIAQTDIQNNGIDLSWSPYSVKSIPTYYIFRGTSPDNMQLLTEVSSSTLAYSDITPRPTGSMYAIGVKDDANDGKNYQSMLFDWQAGYITSNISPQPKNYNRIGVFAFLQNDQPGSTVYLQAVAPKADSIKWKLADSVGTALGTVIAGGTRISHVYNSFGNFDVTAITYTKSVVDSLYLPGYIKINNPVYFNLDTIYKKVGNDTLVINIDRTIVNNVSALSSTPAQWFVDSITNSSVMVQQATKQISTNVISDSLLVWISPVAKDTIVSIPLTGNYLDIYHFSATLTVVVSSKKNQKPVLLDSIPEQVASDGKLFNPLNLQDWIYDDYTQFSQLVFKTDTNPYFVFTVKDGYLYATQTDGTFTGTTSMTLRVIDGGGLETDVPIMYTQPYLIDVSTAKPTVSFYANKTFIKPNGSIRFYTNLSSADSLVWNFGNGVIVSGTKVNPIVSFAKSGKYTISLTAENSFGSKTYTKSNYIIVSALSPSDTLICKGDSVTISVLGAGFDSYSWNTTPIQTTSSIKVSPAQTTNYTVTATKGASNITDSVTITIPFQPNLGKDTTFCTGDSIRLTPGTFVSYAWNGSASSNKASFYATAAGTISVATVDSNKCPAKATVTIKTLYPKPSVNLGKDSTFCWKKSIVLDASVGNAGASFKWNKSTTTKDTLRVDTTGMYSVTVTNADNCSSSDSVNINVIVPFVPQIGLVTQSHLGQNLIAWEPQNNKGISLYHVKILSSSNTYTTIGTVPTDSITVFIDQNSNPLVKSDQYVLTTVDSACGNQSANSPAHSSIHLSCVLQPDGSVIATWNNYIGLPVTNYIIYRGSKAGDTSLAPYVTVSANIDSANTSYRDTNATIGLLNYYYRVEFNLEKDVYPSILKSDTGPFSQSLSNMAESQLTGVEITALDATVAIYPNPANEKLNVAIRTGKTGLYNVELVNTLGQIVYSNKTGTTNETVLKIDVTHLPTGIYSLKVNNNDNGFVVKQVVITR